MGASEGSESANVDQTPLAHRNPANAVCCSPHQPLLPRSQPDHPHFAFPSYYPHCFCPSVGLQVKSSHKTPRGDKSKALSRAILSAGSDSPLAKQTSTSWSTNLCTCPCVACKMPSIDKTCSQTACSSPASHSSDSTRHAAGCMPENLTSRGRMERRLAGAILFSRNGTPASGCSFHLCTRHQRGYQRIWFEQKRELVDVCAATARPPGRTSACAAMAVNGIICKPCSQPAAC